MIDRTNPEKLLKMIPTIKEGLLAPLDGISEENLNRQVGENKMSIGQLVIHCMAWAEYFMGEIKPDPIVPWTCKPVDYPLSLEYVHTMIDAGFGAIRRKLEIVDDESLEVTDKDEKGPGYIIYRLLVHAMVHSNQMAYLRQLFNPEWGFGSHFGNMANVFIASDYVTTPELVRGF